MGAGAVRLSTMLTRGQKRERSLTLGMAAFACFVAVVLMLIH